MRFLVSECADTRRRGEGVLPQRNVEDGIGPYRRRAVRRGEPVGRLCHLAESEAGEADRRGGCEVLGHVGHLQSVLGE